MRFPTLLMHPSEQLPSKGAVCLCALPRGLRGHHPEFGPPGLRVVVRVGGIKLSDQCHRELFYFDHATKEVDFSCTAGESG